MVQGVYTDFKIFFTVFWKHKCFITIGILNNNTKETTFKQISFIIIIIIIWNSNSKENG